MFNWRTRTNLDPYFRAVYAMQFVAALAAAAGLFLRWWDGPTIDALTAFNLLDRSLRQFRDRDPAVITQPLGVLWLLGPAILAGALRGFTGLLVVPVWYRKLALVAWGVGFLSLAHFYINYGRQLADDSPLKDGHIQIGFWLTCSSTLLLGLLILTEWLIRPQSDTWAAQGPVEGKPVNDAERLWRGEYLTCPHCGMLHELGARSCFNCHNVLFDFRDPPP